MRDITMESGRVSVEGDVFAVNGKDSTKKGGAVMGFDITDMTGSVHISRYFKPEEDKSIIGIVAVDLSMSRIIDLIGKIKPTPDATVTMMLTTDLTYMIHPNQSYIMKKSMTDAYRELGISISSDLVQNIKDRKQGKELLSWGAHSSYVYYAPVEKARCAVMIDIPQQTVMAPLKDIFYRMLICVGVGLVVLIGFLISRTKF